MADDFSRGFAPSKSSSVHSAITGSTFKIGGLSSASPASPAKNMQVVGNMLHFDNLIGCAKETSRAVEISLDNCEFVRFEWSGINGESMSKTVPRDRVKYFLKKGLNVFAGAWMMGYSGTMPSMKWVMSRGCPDTYNFADPSTFIRQLPYSAGSVGRVIVEPYFQGCAVPHPRPVARKLLRQLREMGLRFYGAFEYEFTAYKDGEPVSKGVEIFHTFRNNFDEKLMLECAHQLKQLDIHINTMNSEYGAGQQEWTVQPSWGISVADDAFTFRSALKEIFRKHGYDCTFMTKVGEKSAGVNNGGHFNFSVWNDENNEFYDNKTEELSDVAKQFAAGILKHAAAVTTLSNPSEICFKRIATEGNWAPSNASWGNENRTAFLQTKSYDESRTYFELRTPSAAANPYLVLCAVLAAGLDGIKNKLTAPEPCPGYAPGLSEEQAAPLPKTLAEGLEALEKNEVFREAFSLPDNETTGADLIDAYVDTKRAELDAIKKSGHDIWKWYTDGMFNLI